MNSKIITGKIVHIISIIWSWSKNRFVLLEKKIIIILRATSIIIIVRIIIVKSWKYDNSSIVGEALSCRVNINHVGISNTWVYQ